MFELTLEFLIILLLILANGVFAMAEIAVVSARKVRLEQQANTGNANARAALELANAPNHFLAAVQIGITLITILAGAFGGATIAAKLAAPLRGVPLLAPYSETLSLGIVVLTITYLSLILGELVPKRIALHNPERVAARVAAPMRTLTRLTAPLIRLLNFSTDLVLKPLGLQGKTEAPITEEEIKILIQQGTQAGLFDAAEQDLIGQIFRLGDRRVNALMRSRPEIVWIDPANAPADNQRKVAESYHSHFVVARGDLDDVVGVVHIKDLFAASLACQTIDWAAMARPPLFVPESMRALRVLEMFKTSGTHIALAVDEYGIVQGLITLNDLLEAIVGEVPLAGEPARLEAVQRADGSWLLDGMLPLDQVKELLKLTQLPGETEIQFQTLGGFVLSQLGRIPVPADHFEVYGLRFEVVDMDDKRIDKVLVAPATRPATPAPSTERR
ncbi:MAG: HlyC/CorC family transporter [Chloroflexi bacterium]|nr:HlyC/CorC family transporter [Chloroflexota bacterium]